MSNHKVKPNFSHEIITSINDFCNRRVVSRGGEHSGNGFH